MENRNDLLISNSDTSYSRPRTFLEEIELYSKLQNAAKTGDMELVKQHVAKGAKLELTHALDGIPKNSPIKLAFKNGHIAVVTYLEKIGANSAKLDFSMSTNNNSRKWLKEKFSLSIASVIKKFEQSSLPDYLAMGKNLQYAIQLGDLAFLQKYQDTLAHLIATHPPDGIFDPPASFAERAKQHKLHSHAAKFGQLAILKFLDENNIQESTEPYIKNMLIEAVTHQQIEIIDYLLQEKKYDINRQDHDKNTAVMTAVIHRNEMLFKKLMNENPDLTKTSIDDENIFHLAAKIKNKAILEVLFNLPTAKKLSMQRNIYGRTAFDIAMENKNDIVLKFFISSDENLEEIKKLPAYGLKLSIINQSRIIKKMYHYLKLQGQDTTLFPIIGYCNGFAFLYLVYAALGKEEEYFFMLNFMSEWDGQIESLLQERDDLKKFGYKNLKEVFEQWINDVVVFQSHNLASLKKIILYEQDDRDKQYALIGHKKYPLVTFHSSTDLNLEQVKEMLHYTLKMPIGTCIELSGNKHTTAGIKKTVEQFNYRDANFNYKTTFFSIDEEENILNRLNNYKHLALQVSTVSSSIYLYYFKTPENSLSFENFNLFEPGELPNSREKSIAFQQQSSNGFSHLHLAVMTRSKTNLIQLLKDGHVDPINPAKNNQTALDIAIKNEYFEGIELLMTYYTSPQHPESSHQFDQLAYQVYLHSSKNVLNFILSQPQSQNMNLLFHRALCEKDFPLANKLLTEKKVNFDYKNLWFKRSIEWAKLYPDIQQCFLQHGIDVNNLPADCNRHFKI